MHIILMRSHQITYQPTILMIVLDTTLITPSLHLTSPSPSPIFCLVVYSPTNSLI